MAPGSPAAHLRASNLVTYVAVAAALVAAVCTDGPASRPLAGAALAVAVVADLFDGRFARLFPRTDEQKQFGVQIDSLADALSFGLAPVVVLGRLLEVTSSPSRAAFLACALVYVLCAITRLAYYNVTQGEDAGFVGVPTTMLGVFWSAWLLAEPRLIPSCVALVVGAAAMVSPVRIPRPGAKAFVVLVVVSVGLVVAHLVR